MNFAMIVAAGRGYRVGGPLPKQYLPLGGQPILRHTIEAFVRHPQIDAIQVVIHPDDAALYAAATAGLAKLQPVQFGGETRQESARKGLEAIAACAPAAVLIHDAVRPFVAPETISAVLAALAQDDAALTAMKLSDTLKRAENGLVTGTLPRQNLYRAQTPQGFRYAQILAAHRAAAGEATEFTDDAMIAEWAGLKVRLVEGTEENFKITTPADLARAEFMLTLQAGGSQPPARS